MNDLSGKILALVETTGRVNDIETKIVSFRVELAGYIEQLVNTDFAGLIQLLYKLDIDEQKLRQALKDRAGEDSATIIADLIILRQQQKFHARKEFRDNNEIPEEDKW